MTHAALDDNKTLARRALMDVWGKGNLDAIDAIFAPDFVSHQDRDPRGAPDVVGRDALKAFVAQVHAGLSNYQERIDDQIAEDDKVVTRFTFSGTHTGPMLGIAPTGKHVDCWGIQIDHIVDGRIVDNWVCWDMAGLLRQLGKLG